MDIIGGMRKALFIFNPHAGKGRIASSLSTIVDTLTKAGFLVTTYPTQAKADAIARIQEIGSSFDRIIVAGGDGMLHEAVNGIMKLENRPDLAYIPSGTVNDFAISHKIPKAIRKAAELAASDHRRSIDIGSFNNEYFSYVAACGAVTDIPYTTDQGAKNAFGFLAYLANAAKYVDFKTLTSACRKMEIVTDNEVYKDDFLVCCVSNSKTIGSMKQLVPKDSDLSDGLMEGLFIKKPRNIFELNQALNLLLTGNMHASKIISVKSSKFEFHIEQDTQWTLDGEDGGNSTDVIVQNNRQCLTMILP